MAKVYITEHTQLSVYQGGLLPVVYMPPLATQVVAIGGTTTLSTQFNAKTQMVAIHTDAICSVEFGTSSVVATANSRRLAASSTEYFQVTPGSYLAVITNT